MSWFRSGLPSISISDWLAAAPDAAEPAHGLEDVRQAMFDALGEAGGRKRAMLLLRIRLAPDVHSLWALRPEVMQAVSHMHGESEGRRRLALATEKFEGLLPEAALTTRRRGIRMAAPSP